MWSIETRWFDVAVVSAGFALGSILFGRFEEFKGRGRRVLKFGLVLGVTIALAQTLGRAWAYSWMVIPLAIAGWAHLIWLPRHGINGWTAEPRDRYLELVRTLRLRDLLR
jgi:hypothetical protein